MKLGEWLREKGIPQRQLGELLGLTQGRISQIIRDGTDSISLARRIESTTQGAVTLNDLSVADPHE